MCSHNSLVASHKLRHRFHLGPCEAWGWSSVASLSDSGDANRKAIPIRKSTASHVVIERIMAPWPTDWTPVAQRRRMCRTEP